MLWLIIDMKTDADNKEQLTKRNSAKDLLEDVKDIRNDMVTTDKLKFSSII